MQWRQGDLTDHPTRQNSISASQVVAERKRQQSVTVDQQNHGIFSYSLFEYKDDHGKKDKKAIDEVNALIDEIFSRENIIKIEEAV